MVPLHCRGFIATSQFVVGTTLRLEGVDGRMVMVPLRDVVSPHSVRLVRGEGMPLSKSPRQRGDLQVRPLSRVSGSC